MYLSRIELDERNRATAQALESPGILHGAVESSLAGPRERNLWRIDHLDGKCFLLILSHRPPHMTQISSQFGRLGDKGETRNYDTLVERIAAGQSWRFRLRANPILSAATENESERGRIHAHVTTEQQRRWLMERAEKSGFTVEPDNFEVVDTRWYTFAKKRGESNAVTIRTATFEGILRVTDASLFTHALTRGIGKAKAYGCGLLTIMQAKGIIYRA